MSNFKQLIPGNPGTSFVVALLYIINNKYKTEIYNKDQLSIFTKGIVKSKKVFWSGILNTIASNFNLNISVYSNSNDIIESAKSEINKKCVSLELNPLDPSSIDELLSKFDYLALSVDLYAISRLYHDYHFVSIKKEDNEYEIFDPKSGTSKVIGKRELTKLAKSVPNYLDDILLAFCC